MTSGSWLSALFSGESASSPLCDGLASRQDQQGSPELLDLKLTQGSTEIFMSATATADETRKAEIERSPRSSTPRITKSPTSSSTCSVPMPSGRRVMASVSSVAVRSRHSRTRCFPAGCRMRRSRSRWNTCCSSVLTSPPSRYARCIGRPPGRTSARRFRHGEGRGAVAPDRLPEHQRARQRVSTFGSENRLRGRTGAMSTSLRPFGRGLDHGSDHHWSDPWMTAPWVRDGSGG
jgi:hypothetical protein